MSSHFDDAIRLRMYIPIRSQHNQISIRLGVALQKPPEAQVTGKKVEAKRMLLTTDSNDDIVNR